MANGEWRIGSRTPSHLYSPFVTRHSRFLMDVELSEGGSKRYSVLLPEIDIGIRIVENRYRICLHSVAEYRVLKPIPVSIGTGGSFDAIVVHGLGGFVQDDAIAHIVYVT